MLQVYIASGMAHENGRGGVGEVEKMSWEGDDVKEAGTAFGF
jgi:hypothetical protein